MGRCAVSPKRRTIPDFEFAVSGYSDPRRTTEKKKTCRTRGPTTQPVDTEKSVTSFEATASINPGFIPLRKGF